VEIISPEKKKKATMENQDNTPTLLEVQGIIATCAIENREHDNAYNRCNKLIEKYGAFARIKNWKELCYIKPIQ